MTYTISSDFITLLIALVSWLFLTWIAGMVFWYSIYKKDFTSASTIITGLAFFFLIFLMINAFTQWIVIN